MLENIIANWSGRDPEGAEQFADTLADGQSRDELIRRIAGTWARSDSATALNWVQSMPAGDGRAGAMASVLAAWASQSPQDAARYISQLSGRDTLEKAAQQWLRVDDKAARATIQASGFPPDLIAKLLKRTD